ncbi:serine hydrolase [Actinomycetota bacterium Odt1-20B]
MGIHPRHWRTPVAAALTSALLTPVPLATAAAASTGQGTQGSALAAPCTAAKDPTLAKNLSRDLKAALAHRSGTVSVSLHDDRTGLTCDLSGQRRYDAASVAKVLILETALRRAESWRRKLTGWEQRNARPMITRSDNGAAWRLWTDLGHTTLSRFLRRVGTTATTLGHDGYWGLTRTTAADQLRLLGVLTGARDVLRASSRAYGLNLLSQVRRDQRWGVPAGMPRGITAHLKNGWLPRATHGWRVHSVGAFTGGGRTYRLAVLSHDNPTMAYGVRTIERIAQAVHRALNKGRAAGQGLTPPSEISEIPDGSVPDTSSPLGDNPEP